jgi:hypothetical protein
MSARHRTQVCNSRQFEAEWVRLIDELSRRGVLGSVGAADALLGVAGELPDGRDQAERGAP